jgi:hypothetical protein
MKVSVVVGVHGAGFMLGLLVTAAAIPVPILDVADLTRRADVVVIGTIGRLSRLGHGGVDTPVGRVSGQRIVAELVPNQFLKGSSSDSPIGVRFVVPDEPIGFAGVVTSRVRVFFLRRGSEEYEFVSPYHPSVIAMPGSDAAGSSLDRVADAITSVSGILCVGHNMRSVNAPKTETAHL